MDTEGIVPSDILNYVLELRHDMAFKVQVPELRVIFNGPATVLIDRDGNKTVVKKRKEDAFNGYAGLAAALLRKHGYSKQAIDSVMIAADEANAAYTAEPHVETADIVKGVVRLYRLNCTLYVSVLRHGDALDGKEAQSYMVTVDKAQPHAYWDGDNILVLGAAGGPEAEYRYTNTGDARSAIVTFKRMLKQMGYQVLRRND